MGTQVISRLLDIISKNDVNEIKLDDYPKTIDSFPPSGDVKIPSLTKLYEDIKSKDNNSTFQGLCDKVKCCATKEIKWYNTPVSVIITLSLAIIFFFFLACFGFSFLILGETCLYYLYLFVCLASILTATILLFNKSMQIQYRKSEIEAKLKEKMMDKIVNAFNEDRDNRMLLIKNLLSLHERLEKARIEQWERIKEHERKMNCCEQERKDKLSSVLVELAKIQDKETTEDSQKKEKTIIKETSILQSLLDK